MKVTAYTMDEKCLEIVTVEAAHVCMFNKDYSVQIHFLTTTEQIKFIQACIKHYVLIQIQGAVITLPIERDNGQRIRFRFDDSK